MGETPESMTADEFVKRGQQITLIGRLEATEDESRVKLILASGCADSSCHKSVSISKDAIQEVRAMRGARVAEIVLSEQATFTASEVFGEHGLAVCRCAEGAVTARMANAATTTVDRCRACGCVYDGLNCRCGSARTADCASRPGVAPPYVIGVRYTE
jgi:hypothetical protein